MKRDEVQSKINVLVIRQERLHQILLKKLEGRIRKEKRPLDIKAGRIELNFKRRMGTLEDAERLKAVCCCY